MQDIKTMTRSLFDAYNNREFDKFTALSSDRLEWVDQATGVKFTGKNAIRMWCQAWVEAFPDARVEVINHFATNDQACTEYIGRGKHTGVLVMGNHRIPASNKTVEFKMCNVIRVADGKIAQGHAYFDLLGFMRQIGVEPAKLAA
jgi:steroid delta-isomerase-like uncharacterized protein